MHTIKNMLKISCIFVFVESQCTDISKETIKDGRILSNNRLLGSLAVYECNRGYRIVGDRTRVCQ